MRQAFIPLIVAVVIMGQLGVYITMVYHLAVFNAAPAAPFPTPSPLPTLQPIPTPPTFTFP